jgi:hypothetical protein
METLVEFLFVHFIPLSHGVGVSVMLAMIVLMEQVILMPHLSFRPVFVCDSGGVLNLGILNC